MTSSPKPLELDNTKGGGGLGRAHTSGDVNPAEIRNNPAVLVENLAGMDGNPADPKKNPAVY
ncbi:hypothetical protein [Rossellomorea sp. YZS02]|uniref:hypothetical protein n=1 Tax=Rossellomorea sp. YZS02 TaxID=3097358 RepID=UPI002A248C93|nr:hypothetical protein [Rossellomorea sp. YZS02]